MMLHDVNIGINGHKTRKRVGRGPGSGHGKTSGRGHKGAGSRSGTKRRLGFEGGQKPLMRRIAKRGFSNNFFALKIAEVNLSAIEKAFEVGEVVTPEQLSVRGLAKGRFDQVKILGDGDLTKSLSVTAHRFSASAEEKILAAGGSTVKLV
ncbi:ribosomal protein L15 [Planctopirus limnophila DSM 3776]|uniref:Large ribosomal subunit protein uL15 n=2 Tax=Planctopirus TaxID=1649480 RepID=D5SQ92_PLAL2|nr:MULTISPECIES: 50S ribosomal protein L15 [Planctopirus]ADG66344.1 ribosomal protein L15 [Planctopirus limnophila DSM 3776]ODA30421.1 50S ribosomal protein L15 [Planctopirus hydrillae]